MTKDVQKVPGNNIGLKGKIRLAFKKVNRTRLEFLFGTEIFRFCDLMKTFLSNIAIAMMGGKEKTRLPDGQVRVQSVKIAGKRETQDGFIN